MSKQAGLWSVDDRLAEISAGGDPLEFTLGDDMVIPGFESAVGGLAVGESATVTLGVDDAYGPHNDDAVAMVAVASRPSRCGEMILPIGPG